MDAALQNVFTNMGLTRVPYCAEALLKEYLPDSLALVLFMVEAEKVFHVSVPPGGFDLGWMDKPLYEVAACIKNLKTVGDKT